MTKTLNQLSEATTLADDDLLLARDTSAVEDKRITVANLKETSGINARVIRVSSRTEMKAYDVPAGYQFSLEEGGRSGIFVRRSGTPPVSDPEEGVFVIKDGTLYDERIGVTNYDPRWFGARGDGSDVLADKQAERAALQACHDFVNAIGGGTIEYFKPDDRFKIDQGLVLYSNTRYLGNGNDDIIIEQTDANEPVAASEAWWNNTGADRNIVVDGLYFRGDNAAGAENHGCILLAYFSKIQNCFAAQCGGRGIGFTEKYRNGTDNAGTLAENKLDNLKVYDCVGVGVFNGEGTGARSKLTDGIADRIIVRQVANPTTAAVEYRGSAGWKIGYHHTYSGGAGAPSTAILIDGAFFTGIDGPFYVEDYTARGVGVTNYQRASNIGAVNAISSSATDPEAAALYISALGSNPVYVSVDSATAYGSVACYAVRAQSSLVNIKINHAFTISSPAADGNPVLAANAYHPAKVNVWSKELDESGNSLTYDGVKIPRQRTFEVNAQAYSASLPLYPITDFKSVTGVVHIKTRSFHNGSPRAEYLAHYSVIHKTGATYTVDVIELANSGFSAPPTISFDSANNELDVSFTQTDSDGRGVVTLTANEDG